MSKSLKSNYKPTADHFRHALLLFFHQKKNVAESHGLLQEAYSELAPSKTFCEIWFKRFKNGDLDICDKERGSGKPPRQFKDEEIKALFNEKDTQTLQELADALGVSRSNVSLRLSEMGIIPKDEK